MNLKNPTAGPTGALRTERAGSARAEGSPAVAPATTPIPAAPAPAVSVKMSDVAAGTLAAAVSDTGFSDSELLLALKQRIQSGNFHIDYAGVARSLVEDAVQSIGQHRAAPR